MFNALDAKNARRRRVTPRKTASIERGFFFIHAHEPRWAQSVQKLCLAGADRADHRRTP